MRRRRWDRDSHRRGSVFDDSDTGTFTVVVNLEEAHLGVFRAGDEG
jgi:hypothetical protein